MEDSVLPGQRMCSRQQGLPPHRLPSRSAELTPVQSEVQSLTPVV